MNEIAGVNIIFAIMLVLVTLFACGCNFTTTIIQPSTTTVTQIVTKSEIPAVTTTPPYTTYTMTLSHDKNPGTYPIYLQNNDILHLLWHTENQVEVDLLIVTPSGKGFGFDSEGTLMEGISHDSSGGVGNISTSDLGGGTGYYTLFLDSSGAAANVVIEYWIESKS